MKNVDEKKSKVGPREARLREMREARVEENKRKINKNVEEMGKVFKVKGGKLPTKKVVVQFKKRTGRGR